MFALDDRLRQDTLPIGSLALCELLLMNDARYPWCILVPRHADAVEVFNLAEDQQACLWREASLVAQRLHHRHQAHKTNIATLGNVVKQLHIHVIARFQGDDAWPAPVWGRLPAVPYTAQTAQERVAELRQLFADVLQAD